MTFYAPTGPTMLGMNDPGLGQAFHGGHHYENFPVASWLLPERMRAPTLAFYRFARTGDDLADEGDWPAEHRSRALEVLRSGLTLGSAPQSSALQGIGARLAEHCARQGVSTQPAQLLLEAFHYDAHFQPFADWAAVQAYCGRSANPVGRMVLAFAGLGQERPEIRAEIEQLSDAVCTGLQLVNFAQDFGQDLARHRPTLPQSEWPSIWTWDTQGARLIASGIPSQNQQAAITRSLAQRGLDQITSARLLPKRLRQSRLEGRRRLALEIAVTMEGGSAMARRVLRDPIGPWGQSPRLSRLELIRCLPGAFGLWVGLTGPAAPTGQAGQ